MGAVREIDPKTHVSPAYDADYVGWIEAQVAHLRAGRLQALDIANLVEELEDLGRSETRALRSALDVVLRHMLKWDYQPDRRSRSWILSIIEHRDRAEATLAENPSLKQRLSEVVAAAYKLARSRAARETRLPRSIFPETCPYSVDDILERAFALDGVEI